MKRSALILALLVFIVLNGYTADWKEVQKMKLNYITQVARHAMDQQKRNALPSVSIAFPSSITDSPKLKILSKSGNSLKIKADNVRNEPRDAFGNVIHFQLPKTMDLLSKGSGFTMLVKTVPNSSNEVRFGMRLIGKDGKTADILPMIPVVDRWGEQTHELYFDWSFINYGKVQPAIDVLKQVDAIEFLVSSVQRAPERGLSKSPQSASFTLSNLKLVDYLKGSYDPARHSWKEGVEPDLTLQQRCGEVTGIVAVYGGKEGVKSAIESLDLAARTQCWDGSFNDTRRGANTITSGEYTFGFTTYGLLCGYVALDKAKVPDLNQKITIGPNTMTRRDFYKRMFYRAALAREGICGPTKYRDDIIGDNTLISGANRVLGYAIAMRLVADIFEGEKKQEIMTKFDEIMSEILDAQGKFSGGFPVLGEGDRFNGKGIHYDSGYTRTHMDWLVLAAYRTGDPRFIQMLRRYQDVFVAAMDPGGNGLLSFYSERGHSNKTNGVSSLVIPDVTAQVGMKYNLPIIAQWGYNNGMGRWKNWNDRSGNFWSGMSHSSGYDLAAHSQIMLDDFIPEPEPQDIGYLFPRQFPIWSSTLYNKKNEPVTTSHVYINPDGKMTNDFKIEVGVYPETVGVPVSVQSSRGTVIATALKLDGWPKLLPANASMTVTVNGEKQQDIQEGKPFDLTITGKSIIIISGPEIQLPKEAGSEKVPFKAIFTLEPQGNQKSLPVTLTVNREPLKYTHEYVDLAKVEVKD